MLLALAAALASPEPALAQPLPPDMPPIGRTRAGPVLPPEAPIGRTRAEPVLPQPRPDGSSGLPIGNVEPPPPGEVPPLPEDRPDAAERAADPEDAAPPSPELPEQPDHAAEAAPELSEPADDASVPVPTPQPDDSGTAATNPTEPADDESVPLPPEQPDETGEAKPEPAAPGEDAEDVPVPPEAPVEDIEARGPDELGEAEAAACEAELDRLDVRFTRLDPIADGACGAERPLMVAELGTVELSNGATLRCPVALATARWVREVVVPAAALHLDATVAALDISASYTCRARRTGSPTTTLSEHGFANAIDIGAVRLGDGRRVVVMPREDSASPDRAFQAAIRGGACVLFTTVIGPMTNALHDDHLHLDLAQRRGGGKLCE